MPKVVRKKNADGMTEEHTIENYFVDLRGIHGAADKIQGRIVRRHKIVGYGNLSAQNEEHRKIKMLCDAFMQAATPIEQVGDPMEIKINEAKRRREAQS